MAAWIYGYCRAARSAILYYIMCSAESGFFGRYRAHIKPNERRLILLHLSVNFFCHHVAGLKFVGEAFEIFIKQHRTLSANRFRNEKAPARFFGIQRRGMNLYIVYVVHSYSSFKADCHAVARENTEVCRLAEYSAYSSARKHGVVGKNFKRRPVLFTCDNAKATLIRSNDVKHSHFRNYFNVFKQTYFFH